MFCFGGQNVIIKIGVYGITKYVQKANHTSIRVDFDPIDYELSFCGSLFDGFDNCTVICPQQAVHHM